MIQGLSKKQCEPTRVSDSSPSATEPNADNPREFGTSVEPALQDLATRWQVPFRADCPADEADPGFIDNISISFARAHVVLGLAHPTGIVRLVFGDVPLPTLIDTLSKALACPTLVEFAPEEVVLRAVDAAYAARDVDVAAIAAEGSSNETDAIEIRSPEGDLLDDASGARTVRLVNGTFGEAIKRGASDVHFQPYDTTVQIRFRIDGVLYDYLSVPRETLEEITSRIKILGGMDIAERRLAQDGRCTVHLGSREVDLRISVIPTSFGERVVVRFLDKSTRLLTLEELGMAADVRAQFESLVQRPHGMILVTGPTGSGKSTTLYGVLQYLDASTKNIITLEDPIEYRLPGVSQTQVATRKGMTFATGLRAVLRQDPDVIMVGEIRDEETARMAIQSALTGHLVFSTLHTNDAASAVSRLMDLGVEPYLVASCLIASLAQRLVRCRCTACALTRPDSGAGAGKHASEREVQPACSVCNGTGFRGRTGIFELMTVNDEIRALITQQARSSDLHACATRNGMLALHEDALRKVEKNVTTIAEVQRVSVA